MIEGWMERNDRRRIDGGRHFVCTWLKSETWDDFRQKFAITKLIRASFHPDEVTSIILSFFEEKNEKISPFRGRKKIFRKMIRFSAI